MDISRFDRWHQTNKGLLVFGLLELGLAYIAGSLAIDNGSLIVYAIMLIVLFGGLNNLFRLVRNKMSKHE